MGLNPSPFRMWLNPIPLKAWLNPNLAHTELVEVPREAAPGFDRLSPNGVWPDRSPFGMGLNASPNGVWLNPIPLGVWLNPIPLTLSLSKCRAKLRPASTGSARTVCG
ncbi:hypothetical protein BH11PSE8_BH11PSE8_43010 [soil metagenome]